MKARLDLDVLANDLAAMLADEGLDSRLLGLQAEAALALTGGADPEVDDIGGRILGHGGTLQRINNMKRTFQYVIYRIRIRNPAGDRLRTINH